MEYYSVCLFFPGIILPFRYLIMRFSLFYHSKLELFNWKIHSIAVDVGCHEAGCHCFPAQSVSLKGEGTNQHIAACWLDVGVKL